MGLHPRLFCFDPMLSHYNFLILFTSHSLPLIILPHSLPPHPHLSTFSYKRIIITAIKHMIEFSGEIIRNILLKDLPLNIGVETEEIFQHHL